MPVMVYRCSEGILSCQKDAKNVPIQSFTMGMVGKSYPSLALGTPLLRGRFMKRFQVAKRKF